jgi:hypothetical protein
MHLLVPGYELTLSGNDADDAHRYQERDVRDFLARIREARRSGLIDLRIEC